MGEGEELSNSGWGAEIVNDMERILLRYEIAAQEHVLPLADMLMHRPDEAIPRIFEVYNKGLDAAYTDEDGNNAKAFIQAIAGGPHEAVPHALYNAVGSVYPYLRREQKNSALNELLKIYDRLNYADVNGLRGVGHTTGIREPLLLADIQIANHLYWPGLEDEERVLEGFSSWLDLRQVALDENGMFNPRVVRSDFCAAYCLLRSDKRDYGEQYVSVANPGFLDRTVRAIVAMRFARHRFQKDLTEANIKKGRARLIELLPESLYDRIDSIREEADWADPAVFYPNHD